MMEIFIRNPLDPVFEPGVMYSIDLVYQFILAPHFLKTKDEEDFMRVKYEIVKKCPLGCHHYSQEYKNFWARRNHTCKVCGTVTTPVRKFIRPPFILAISVNGMGTKIDQILNYEGANYSVFIVALTL
jgi:hypothetical protein